MQRLTASVLAAGMVLMAWSACAGGAMTMSEMLCCAEHHDACEMAGMAESCCGPDQHADIGMLKPERADDALVLATHDPVAATLAPHDATGRWAWSWVEVNTRSPHVPLHRHLLHTILLI